MSYYKILKKQKEINSKRDIRLADKAKIYIEDNEIYLETNGKPFIVEIYYKGAVQIRSHMGAFFKLDYHPSKIKIINIFNRTFPEKLFSFYGKIEVMSCEITQFGQNPMKANVVRNNDALLIHNQQTNLEDDTLVIREEPEVSLTRPIKSGKVKSFKKQVIGEMLSREKLDKEQLLTIIPEVIEKIKAKPISTPKIKTTAPVKTIAKPIKKGKY